MATRREPQPAPPGAQKPEPAPAPPTKTAEVGAIEVKMFSDRICLLGKLAIDTDPALIDHVLDVHSSWDAAGAILQPTAWIHGHERTEAMRDYVVAFREFREAAVKFKAKVLATEGDARVSRQSFAPGMPFGPAAEDRE